MIALNSAEVLKFYKTEEVCSNLNFLISPIIFRVHFAEHKVFQDTYIVLEQTFLSK